MQKLQLFRPNKESTGCAVSFGFGVAKKNNEVNLYIGAVKQASWDAKTETGSFKANGKNPEKTLNAKMSDWEVGGMIAALLNMDRFSAYHKNDAAKTVTTISISPFVPKKVRTAQGMVDNTENVQRGFALTIVRDKTLEFKALLSFGDAMTLVEYLRTGLNLKFGMDVSYDNTNEQPDTEQTRTATPPVAQQKQVEDEPDVGMEEDVPF